MATTSCPSSFKVSGSPTGSKSPPTPRPRNPKPPPPDPSGHHQDSAIAPQPRLETTMPGKVEEAWIEPVSTHTIAMPLQDNRAHIVVQHIVRRAAKREKAFSCASIKVS